MMKLAILPHLFIPPVEPLATAKLFQILAVSAQNDPLASKHCVQYARLEVPLPTCFLTRYLLFINFLCFRVTLS